MGLKKPRATIQDYGIEKLKIIRQAAQDISKRPMAHGKRNIRGLWVLESDSKLRFDRLVLFLFSIATQ